MTHYEELEEHITTRSRHRSIFIFFFFEFEKYTTNAVGSCVGDKSSYYRRTKRCVGGNATTGLFPLARASAPAVAYLGAPTIAYFLVVPSKSCVHGDYASETGILQLWSWNAGVVTQGDFFLRCRCARSRRHQHYGCS
jgi:hypothetical protein